MKQKDTSLPMNTVATIQKVTASRYGKTIGDLNSSRRSKDVTHPRHIAMTVAKRMTGKSYPVLGRHFGGRDHSTVINAVTKIEQQAAHDQELCNELEMIEQQVRDGAGARVDRNLSDLATRLAPLIARRLSAERQPENERIIIRELVRYSPDATPLTPEIDKVVSAFTRLENDQYTRGESGARRALENALKVLRAARATHKYCSQGEQNV